MLTRFYVSLKLVALVLGGGGGAIALQSPSAAAPPRELGSLARPLASPSPSEPTPQPSPPVSFAAYGDLPYLIPLGEGRTDAQVLSERLAPALRQRDDLPFVIHYGDLGRPQEACSDAWLAQTQQFWQTELRKPVFYTPGDNEWTDCDRPTVAQPTSELARLAVLRQTFFADLPALGPEWRYERQASLPENARWWHRGVLFVTQHMVSTDNGRTEILRDDPSVAIAEVNRRDQENLLWLEEAFERAQANDTAAVVVAMQLDPFGAPDGKTDAWGRCLGNPAYRDLCLHLPRLAAQLNKPVLLLHGDTNAYCLDQPFAHEPGGTDQPAVVVAPNLWRLNGPGDYQVIDAVVVSFDASHASAGGSASLPEANRPFTATGLLSGQPAPTVCDYEQK